MCAAHTDLARAQSANNQQVHSESDFFFFFKEFAQLVIPRGTVSVH